MPCKFRPRPTVTAKTWSRCGSRRAALQTRCDPLRRWHSLLTRHPAGPAVQIGTQVLSDNNLFRIKPFALLPAPYPDHEERSAFRSLQKLKKFGTFHHPSRALYFFRPAPNPLMKNNAVCVVMRRIAFQARTRFVKAVDCLGLWPVYTSAGRIQQISQRGTARSVVAVIAFALNASPVGVDGAHSSKLRSGTRSIGPNCPRDSANPRHENVRRRWSAGNFVERIVACGVENDPSTRAWPPRRLPGKMAHTHVKKTSMREQKSGPVTAFDLTDIEVQRVLLYGVVFRGRLSSGVPAALHSRAARVDQRKAASIAFEPLPA